MKTKHSLKMKSLMSAFLAVVMILGTLPVMNVFAAQKSDYEDPADNWLKTNNRTNELDMNATVPLPYRDSDYEFVGWFTEDGEKVSSDKVYHSDTTLTAKWRITGTRTLTFATEDGTYIRPVTAEYGSVIKLTDYIPTRAGYIFEGWYTDPQTKENDVTSIELTDDETVYAKWTPTVKANAGHTHKDIVYMTDDEIRLKTETVKKQTETPELQMLRWNRIIQLIRQIYSVSE